MERKEMKKNSIPLKPMVLISCQAEYQNQGFQNTHFRWPQDRLAYKRGKLDRREALQLAGF